MSAAAIASAPRSRLGLSPDYRARRELAWALLAGLVLAIVMFWPLALHLQRDMLNDPLDPKLQAWELSWDAHAFLTQPFHFFQANMYWPNADVLAFSDALIGYLPLGLIGELSGGGVQGALLGYNLACLVAFSVAFAGPYLLGRELGLGRAAAAVAGIVYAWSPWRWPQVGHLHIVSCGAMIVAIALLLRGYRRGRPRAVLGGWLFFGWQLLIGVSIGLQAIYLVALLGGVFVVLWWRNGRPRPERAIIKASVIGLAIVFVATVWMGIPYLRARHDHPEVVRSLDDIRFLSPPLKGLLAPPEDNLLWGNALSSFRSGLRWPPEMLIFPGFAMFVLAVPGLFGGGVFSRRLRIGLLATGIVTLVFALGTTVDDGDFTYKLLFNLAPGWGRTAHAGPPAGDRDAAVRAAGGRRYPAARRDGRQPAPCTPVGADRRVRAGRRLRPGRGVELALQRAGQGLHRR